MGKYIYKTDGHKIIKREYIADVTWYYNIPSLKHNKKIIVDAYNSWDAMDTIYRMYPNVQSCVISESKDEGKS